MKNGKETLVYFSSFNPLTLALCLSLVFVHPGHADNTWDGGGINGNWSTNANWGADTAPTLPGALTFAGTSQLISTNDLTGITVNSFTFGATAGAFVLGGNAITLAGALTNSSTNLQTMGLAITTTAERNVTMTTGGGNVTLSGDISGTLGGIATAGTGTLILSGNNSFTGNSKTVNGTVVTIGVTANGNGVVGIGSNTALGNSAAFVALNTGSIQAVGGARTIANGVFTNNANGTISGTNDLTVNGLLVFGGGNTITVSNTGTTTFAGDVHIRDNGTGARTGTFNGTGNVVISGNISNGLTGTAGSMAYSGTGSLTLSGNNTYTSGTTANLGTVILSNNGVNGSLAGGTVVVGSGATPVANVSGNATLQVNGNYTIGTAGSGVLNIRGGNTGGVPLGQGTLSLTNNTINTLSINNVTAAATALTLGGTAGNNSFLNLDVGATSADAINLGAGLKSTVNAGGLVLNINRVGNFTNGNSYNLINASGGITYTGAVTIANTGNFGGHTLAVTQGATALSITDTLTYTTPATAYWNGGIDGVWNTFTGGNLNNTNWVNAASAGTDTHQSPGSATDVFFGVSGGGSNLSTTLGAATAINSLTFTSGADVGHQVGVGGVNALTINAGSGTGITVDSGSGAHTISAPVVLGASQTWSINNAVSNGLTVSGGISGSGMGLTKDGTGKLVLTGTNTYSGATTVNAGRFLVNGSGSLAAGSAVAVNSGGYLGGTGTINGATTINSGGMIGGGDMGTVGTLTLAGGLTIGNGGIAYFDNGDLLSITSGGLNVSAGGAIIRVQTGLSSGTYNLITGTGLGSLSGFSGVQYLDGSAAGGNYTLQLSGGTLQLSVATLANPSPTIALDNKRVMANTNFTVTGQVGNGAGGATLNGALSDGGGTLTVGSLSPNPVTVTAGQTGVAVTGSANSGAGLGNRTVRVTVADATAIPSSVTGQATVAVLQDRVVTATSVNLGSFHVGSNVTGTTTLSSSGAHDSNTDVTVANAVADGNGVAVSSGSGTPTSVFDGTHTSDTRTVGGTITGLGNVSGTITLVTTGEAGVTGAQAPAGVSVGYSAQTFSGKARWTSTTGTAWSTASSWNDTLGSGVAGAPGLDGSTVSAGDTASFGDLAGQSTYTISLNGSNPTLQGLMFDSATTTAYTIATGTSGTLNLQSGNTVNVATALSPTISAVMTGTNGLNKTGTGILILSGANTYTGNTSIQNGAIEIAGGNDRITATSAVVLGSGSNSGKLIVGDGAVRTQTIAGLTTSGTGTANAVVGGSASNSTLTVNSATATTYAGTLGGIGVNENNLIFAKTGGGTLTLTGNNTYTGGTVINNGALNLGSANAIGTGNITFTGGALQYSAANTTDYSSRFTTNGTSAVSIDTNGQNITFANGVGFNGTSGLTKSGAGILTLAATGNDYFGFTTINGGLLMTPDNQTYGLKLAGGVWQPLLTGDFSILNTLGSVGSGELNSWTSGGFAAKDHKITITLNGGAGLTYQVGGFMTNGGSPMIFGSATANNQVELTNSFDLNVGDGFQKIFQVEKGTGGDSALLSGVISASTGANTTAATAGGIKKQGDGILILSGDNIYTGLTIVNAGTLVAGRSSLSGSSGAFGTGTGPSGAPTAPSAIQLEATAGSTSPALMIGGAFEIGRAVTVNNIATTGAYSIGGSTDNAATFSGLITTSQNLHVSQVATTGLNALNITGGITGGATAATKTVSFDNVGAVNVSGTAISDGAGLGKIAVVQAGSGTTTFSGANTYTGGTVINGGVLSAGNSSALGTAAVTVNTSGTLLVQSGFNISNVVVLAGGSYNKNFASGNAYSYAASSSFAGGQADTVASLRAGTAGAARSLNTSFSGSSLALNDASRISDVLNLTGTGTDIFTLQLQVTGITISSVLSWNSAGTWINATLGNAGAGALAGSYAQSWDAFLTSNGGVFNGSSMLGAYGYDMVTNTVWAVVNHNSEFAVTTTAVPEPSTYFLMAVGLAGLWILRRKRFA